MSSLDEIYQEVILDHYKNPRCKGCVDCPTTSCALYNPLCGDQIELSITVKDNVVQEIGFTGHGCSISQSAASMMSEACKGKTVEEAKSKCMLFREMMRGEKFAEDLPELGDSIALEGVRKFSARVKCAMLAWEAMEKCIESPNIKEKSVDSQ